MRSREQLFHFPIRIKPKGLLDLVLTFYRDVDDTVHVESYRVCLSTRTRFPRFLSCLCRWGGFLPHDTRHTQKNRILIESFLLSPQFTMAFYFGIAFTFLSESRWSKLSFFLLVIPDLSLRMQSMREEQYIEVSIFIHG